MDSVNRNSHSAATPDHLPFPLGDEEWLTKICESQGHDEALDLWRNYEVLSPAICGGQGRVYRCRRDDGRIVAVKRIHGGAGASPSAKRRLLRELQIAESLDHPGIIAARTTSLDDELLIESDWVAGRTLIEWCSDEFEPRDFRAIVGVFVAICDALEYAHGRGVIHRDLKPSNILVDGDNRPHILDFGLASTLAEFSTQRTQVTLTEPLLGTPAYAAPEQIAGEMTAIDSRTDLYSVGVLLYEALTGESPYPSNLSLGRLLHAVESHEPLRPRAKTASIPRDLEAITLKLLQKKPELRYAGVAELRADFDRFLRGNRTEARPPGLWFDIRSVARRHPRAAWTLISLIAVMAVALGVAGAYAVRLTQANRATLMAHSAAERVNALLGNMIEELAPPIDDDGAELIPVLDRTAGWLDQELAGEPWAMARAHVAMGLLYGRAQRWAQADVHLTRAIDDYRALGDPDRAAVADAMRLLGLARAYQGSSDAIALQRDALAIARRDSSTGPMNISSFHAAMAATLVAIGGMKNKSGADAEIALSLSVLRGNDRRWFAWEAEHLSAYGQAWIHAGQPLEAIRHLEEASLLFEQADMPLETCPYHRACHAMLAKAYEASGNAAQAEQARKELEAARKHATSIPPFTKGE